MSAESFSPPVIIRLAPFGFCIRIVTIEEASAFVETWTDAGRLLSGERSQFQRACLVAALMGSHGPNTRRCFIAVAVAAGHSVETQSWSR